MAAGRERSTHPSPRRFASVLERPQKNVAKPNRKLNRNRVNFRDGTFSHCGVSIGPRDKQKSYSRYCKGRCERCRDLNLVCIPLRMGNRNYRNRITAEVPCSGPVTHNPGDLAESKNNALRRRPVFVDEKCTRWGGDSIPSESKRYAHTRSCLGKCERCRDLYLVCLCSLRSRENNNWLNCSVAKVPFSGLITYIHENPFAGTCSRCGAHVSPIDDHEPKCAGKCQPCANENEPCMDIRHKRCARCREIDRPCGGRVSHSHSVPEHRLAGCVECDRCGRQLHPTKLPEHRTACGRGM